jgi:hypothetical protein
MFSTGVFSLVPNGTKPVCREMERNIETCARCGTERWDTDNMLDHRKFLHTELFRVKIRFEFSSCDASHNFGDF